MVELGVGFVGYRIRSVNSPTPGEREIVFEIGLGEEVKREVTIRVAAPPGRSDSEVKEEALRRLLEAIELVRERVKNGEEGFDTVATPPAP